MEVLYKKLIPKKSTIEEGVEDKFPDINAAVLSKHIDRCILYKLFSI